MGSIGVVDWTTALTAVGAILGGSIAIGGVIGRAVSKAMTNIATDVVDRRLAEINETLRRQLPGDGG